MNWQAFAAALAGIPALPGAACRGLSEPFDQPVDGETAKDTAYRHQTALSICRGCPALPACTAWVESLPPSRRPGGVVAATLPPPIRRRRVA